MRDTRYIEEVENDRLKELRLILEAFVSLEKLDRGRAGFVSTREGAKLDAARQEAVLSVLNEIGRLSGSSCDLPTIVCLCGSTRFAAEFRAANLEETIAGNIVLSIGCDTKSDSDLIALGELTEEAKAMLDELHKRKIDLADEILVLNIGGYVGDSTRSEIEYAKGLKKVIRWAEPVDERPTPTVPGPSC